MRHYMTSVFIPEDLSNKYQYTFDVGEVTGEGFATVDYKRPKLETTEGETVDHPPITKTEDLNEHLILTLSPVNAITNVKDLTPKKPDKPGGGGGGGGLREMLAMARANGLSNQVANPVTSFIQDLYRLAMFIGSPETSLDFGPTLPLLEVEPGDTWNATASYQPQKLQGKKGKMAPQRLDYQYKYVGFVDDNGKKIHRVTATLHFDNDIAPYINDLMGTLPSESGLRGLKLKLDAVMEFDLDYATKNTLAARATSTGSIVIEVTELPETPLIEENLKGRTRLKLVSLK